MSATTRDSFEDLNLFSEGTVTRSCVRTNLPLSAGQSSFAVPSPSSLPSPPNMTPPCFGKISHFPVSNKPLLAPRARRFGTRPSCRNSFDGQLQAPPPLPSSATCSDKSSDAALQPRLAKEDISLSLDDNLPFLPMEVHPELSAGPPALAPKGSFPINI